MLDGEMPQTIISDEISNISHFWWFEWYRWVYFRDSAVTITDSKLVLGRYLGKIIDVGPAFTEKIIKSNGQVVQRYIYHRLKLEDIYSESEKYKHRQFYQLVTNNLWIEAPGGDFEDLGIKYNPTFEPYDNNDREGQ